LRKNIYKFCFQREVPQILIFYTKNQNLRRQKTLFFSNQDEFLLISYNKDFVEKYSKIFSVQY